MAEADTLTIGIAARNEEKTIRQTLQSVDKALARLPNNLAVNIVVALNGCSDNTELKVVQYIENRKTKSKTTIRIVHSEEGLIQAQRKIVSDSLPDCIVIFLDADLLIDISCLYELYTAMATDSNLRVAWSQVIPYDIAHPSYRNLVLNFADYHPGIMTKRVYFSGRAFAIRGYDVPFESDYVQPIDSKLANFLRLNAGPLIDDVYLSRYIIHSFGPDAIVYVPNAKVHFQPIASLKDFYYSQRRTIFERKRLNLLFPEHAYIVRKFYKRDLIQEAYSVLSIKQKSAFHLYRWLYAIVRKFALLQYRMYGMLLRLGIQLSSCKVWPALKTTKKAFHNEPNQ